MYPRPHTPVPQKIIWIELSGDKLETLAERKFSIRGLNNKVVIGMVPLSTLWMYFSKGSHPPPIFLLIDGGSIFPNMHD